MGVVRSMPRYQVHVYLTQSDKALRINIAQPRGPLYARHQYVAVNAWNAQDRPQCAWRPGPAQHHAR